MFDQAYRLRNAFRSSRFSATQLYQGQSSKRTTANTMTFCDLSKVCIKAYQDGLIGLCHSCDE